MTRVLLTAFEPFGGWSTNVSWLVLERITRELPSSPQITTRRYPVDFDQLPQRLERDLRENYDAAIMLGQASGRTAIEFETIGLNVAHSHDVDDGAARMLFADGPVAYRTALPAEEWARELRQDGLPVRPSYNAGTYLCNAALYTAHYLCERLALRTRAMFIHLPLDVSQVVDKTNPPPSLSADVSAAAVRWVISQFAETLVA